MSNRCESRTYLCCPLLLHESSSFEKFTQAAHSAILHGKCAESCGLGGHSVATDYYSELHYYCYCVLKCVLASTVIWKYEKPLCCGCCCASTLPPWKLHIWGRGSHKASVHQTGTRSRPQIQCETRSRPRQGGCLFWPPLCQLTHGPV